MEIETGCRYRLPVKVVVLNKWRHRQWHRRTSEGFAAERLAC
jgi:hypothetical protein